MRKKPFIIVLSLAFLLLVAGQPQAEANERCRVVSTDTKTATLKRLYLKHNAQPLLIIGGSVYYCPCGARNIAGATEGRTLGGDTEGRNIAGATEGRSLGGDTEGRNIAGATEGRSIGGDTEGRNIAGATEGRSIGGDTEGRNIGGATEGRSIGGDTEGRTLGGDTEGRSIGGDTEGRNIAGATEGRSLGGDTEGRSLGGETTIIACSLTPKCRGFVVNNTFSRTFTIFDGRSISSTKNTCIE